MGSTKIETGGTQTSQATPTAEETRLNQRNLRIAEATEAGQTTMQQSALGLGNKLLGSFEQGNDQWKSLIGGVTSEQQQRMIGEQQRYLNPQFQQAGIMDSGLAYTGSLRAATDLSNQNAQFNVGALQNALNLALSGQAQVQSPVQQNVSQLGSQLAGLRSITGTQTGFQVNPYQGVNLGILGTWGGNYCWVAAEIFGGWDEPKTCAVRYYIGNLAPAWFRNFYLKYGERIAKFIHNKPILKLMLRPLFEYFAYTTKREGVLYGCL